MVWFQEALADMAVYRRTEIRVINTYLDGKVPRRSLECLCSLFPLNFNCYLQTMMLTKQKTKNASATSLALNIFI